MKRTAVWTAIGITGATAVAVIIVMILVAAATDLGPGILRSLWGHMERSGDTILLSGLAVMGTLTLVSVYRADLRGYVPGLVLFTAALANRLHVDGHVLRINLVVVVCCVERGDNTLGYHRRWFIDLRSNAAAFHAQTKVVYKGHGIEIETVPPNPSLGY